MSIGDPSRGLPHDQVDNATSVDYARNLLLSLLEELAAHFFLELFFSEPLKGFLLVRRQVSVVNDRNHSCEKLKLSYQEHLLPYYGVINDVSGSGANSLLGNFDVKV